MTAVRSALQTGVSEESDGADSNEVFSYDDLAKPDRVWLRRAAAEIRVRMRRTVNEIVSSGLVLARARRRLGRGRWEPWLASEAQIPRRSASRLLAVHKVFGKLTGNPCLDRFTPTALYALAEPGVPQSLREYAVQQATDGSEVTAGAVAQWLTTYREPTTAPIKLASKDERLPATFDADKVNASNNWLTLVALLADDNTVHLSHATDVENGDVLATGVLVSEDGRRQAAGATLETVVLKLAGQRREKKCKGACGKVKPLEEYSRRQDRPDGRNAYCLVCERNRVKRYEEVRKRADASGTT